MARIRGRTSGSPIESSSRRRDRTKQRFETLETSRDLHLAHRVLRVRRPDSKQILDLAGGLPDLREPVPAGGPTKLVGAETDGVEIAAPTRLSKFLDPNLELLQEHLGQRRHLGIVREPQTSDLQSMVLIGRRRHDGKIGPRPRRLLPSLRIGSMLTMATPILVD